MDIKNFNDKVYNSYAQYFINITGSNDENILQLGTPPNVKYWGDTTKRSTMGCTSKCRFFWNNTNKCSLQIYSWKSRWKSAEYSSKLFRRCKYRFFTKEEPNEVNQSGSGDEE
ncbi:unnamed protein product [Brassica napus]|uniref:(rape) hypothetical protein n=1 Tax=Brassica napus TaxID=3708 RepID=A0A816SGX3_BRANA|nr:unnamed protein product [Brassica napus]